MYMQVTCIYIHVRHVAFLTFHDDPEGVFEDVEGGKEDKTTEQESHDGIRYLGFGL